MGCTKTNSRFKLKKLIFFGIWLSLLKTCRCEEVKGITIEIK